MRALAIAATGMNAQEQNLEVIANNIANINTTGFKRSRAEFTDLIYQTERLMGVANRGATRPCPKARRSALASAPPRSAAEIQGSLTNTGNQLDLAINGRGWFQVTTPNGDTVYTRDGAFNTNANGQIVTTDGYHVKPAMVVPQRDRGHGEPDRHRVCDVPGQTTPQQLGQLTIANFVNEAGLQALGGNSSSRRRRLASRGRRSRRPRVRHDQAGLSRSLQRRSRSRRSPISCGAARL